MSYGKGIDNHRRELQQESRVLSTVRVARCLSNDFHRLSYLVEGVISSAPIDFARRLCSHISGIIMANSPGAFDSTVDSVERL